MDKFGVIVCPNCKKPKAVDLSIKKTKCFSCNKSIDIKKVKIMYSSNSREKITNAIGLLNAEIEGDGQKFKDLLKNKKFY